MVKNLVFYKLFVDDFNFIQQRLDYMSKMQHRKLVLNTFLISRKHQKNTFWYFSLEIEGLLENNKEIDVQLLKVQFNYQHDIQREILCLNSMFITFSSEHHLIIRLKDELFFKQLCQHPAYFLKFSTTFYFCLNSFFSSF